MHFPKPPSNTKIFLKNAPSQTKKLINCRCLVFKRHDSNEVHSLQAICFYTMKTPHHPMMKYNRI